MIPFEVVSGGRSAQLRGVLQEAQLMQRGRLVSRRDTESVAMLLGGFVFQGEGDMVDVIGGIRSQMASAIRAIGARFGQQHPSRHSTHVE